MRIRDVLYGRSDVKEPVLLELLRCRDVTRLKRVSQSGMRYLGGVKRATNYSRFEHSVGVMLLLRRLGASIEEQVAGLLHDSSHTAFSHIVDFVFERKEEDYAGNMLLKYIESGSVAEILERHNIDVRRIGEYESRGEFGLLERPIPELCADRIDNGLRYMHYAGLGTRSCVRDLDVKNNRIVFLSKKSARNFAYGFLRGTEAEWGNAEEGLRAYMLSNAIRRGVKLRIIRYKSLHEEGEPEILRKLRASGDAKLAGYLKLARSKPRFRSSTKGSIFIDEKVRYVDPVFVSGGKLIWLMQIDGTYRNAVLKENEMLEKGYRLELIGR